MQQSPDLQDVDAFVALAEAGSFAGAGRRLGRDATIVSRRIQALERRLGVRLAERSTRRVALTEAGRAYLERVRPLLLELAAAERETASYGEGRPRGHLRLSLPTSFGRLWLSPLITAFLEHHPDITIEAEFSNRFVDLIGERFDLAVRLGVLPDSRLVVRKLGTRRRLVCAAPSYLARHGTPVRPEQIAGHACLIFSGRANPTVWEFLDEAGGLESVAVHGRMTSDDAEALVDAAMRGLGLLYATDWLVAPQLASGALVEILRDCRIPDEGAIYVVTPSGTGLPTKTRAFSNWLIEHLQPEPPWSTLGGRQRSSRRGDDADRA